MLNLKFSWIMAIFTIFFVFTITRKAGNSEVKVVDYIVPFVNYSKMLLTAPENQLISCLIPKSMSQLTVNIMCLLYEKQEYFKNDYSLNDTWTSQRNCLEEFKFIHPLEPIQKGTVKFAFIRDPLKRFVSFYLDKCVREKHCYDCGTNMRCVVEKVYTNLKKIQNSWHGTSELGYVEQHAAPMSWNCNFHKDIESWELIPIGSDANERTIAIERLSGLLKKQGVNQTLIEKVQEGRKSGETEHSTHASNARFEAERIIQKDPYIQNLIYFFDYLVFPFTKDFKIPFTTTQYHRINHFETLYGS
ncbi:sulfotransferase family protein [Caenorhabditis elegans]|uniref:Uncharacterized protein n=1 Tax=Caenorhabditis elegans TaxID=6239 RepID=G5EEN0_CAEEL|nr:Uncharacterized protein CELE_T15D6.1 [Caenorhabditis elegans]CAB05627.1 Uncharacterized protein CELE_T15D6.1 [Caenorhabditis elegans]|eukprot:NP_493132.1 Uncharacterized protein CELE_T15D6.1 [Caenorhabditis elegans]